MENWLGTVKSGSNSASDGRIAASSRKGSVYFWYPRRAVCLFLAEQADGRVVKKMKVRQEGSEAEIMENVPC